MITAKSAPKRTASRTPRTASATNWAARRPAIALRRQRGQQRAQLVHDAVSRRGCRRRPPRHVEDRAGLPSTRMIVVRGPHPCDLSEIGNPHGAAARAADHGLRDLSGVVISPVTTASASSCCSVNCHRLHRSQCEPVGRTAEREGAGLQTRGSEHTSVSAVEDWTETSRLPANGNAGRRLLRQASYSCSGGRALDSGEDGKRAGQDTFRR